jgi:hypothetical protein
MRLAKLIWGGVRSRLVAQTFQSAVSPISNRQGLGQRNALVNSWRWQVATVANLRYGRLESLRYFGCGVSRARSIRTTIPKSFVVLRKCLARKNAKNAKAILFLFAISAFFCGYRLWLRLCRAGSIRG